jgi:hypothetical protein
MEGNGSVRLSTFSGVTFADQDQLLFSPLVRKTAVERGCVKYQQTRLCDG